MKIIFLIFCVLLTRQVFAIQGGQNASQTSGLSQSIVSLSDLSGTTVTRSSCSGVIVSNHAIITAAHCLYGKAASEIAVVFGSDGIQSQSFRMGTLIIVPNQYAPYSSNLPAARDNYDIGILKFDGGLPLNIQPVQIQTEELTAKNNGRPMWIGGFGLPNTGHLSFCKVSILDGAFSNTEFELNSGPNCTPDGGDSGGPDFQTSGNQILLFGIHNWGWHDQNGIPNMSVEARMSYYGAWILSLTQ